MADSAEEQAKQLRHCVSHKVPEILTQLEECASKAFPSLEDFHFYSNFPQFREPLQAIGSRAEAMLRDIASSKSVSQPPEWPGEDEVETHNWLVGIQDELFERVDSALDEFRKERNKKGLPLDDNEGFTRVSSRRRRKSGKDKAKDGEGVGAQMASKCQQKKRIERCPVPFHVRSVSRPQDKFDNPVDNSNTPFKHSYRRKTAAADLEIPVLDAFEESDGPPVHPLEEELRRMDFLDGLLSGLVEPKQPMAMSETPFTMVDTLKTLKDLASKLQCEREVAVDLENHQYRSFQGFTCLMQISTRVEDFIVDVIELRSHIGTYLGDIFATPKVLKVMHGADSDILWLQRDFGIYVCNLFDTHQASRVLEMETHSLAYLLEKFCDVKTDKRYQLADWRVRPLSTEMLKYAREDTHYLLYLHDLLKQMLISSRRDEADAQDPLVEVYSRSRDVCLKLYEKELLTKSSHLHVYGLHEKQYTSEQIAVVAGLYAWRDKIARMEDESTGYVLPNHLLLKLAEEMPETVSKLLSMLNTRHVLVARNAATLVEIIRQSRQQMVIDKEFSSSISAMSKQYHVRSSGEKKKCSTVPKEHMHQTTGDDMKKGSLEKVELCGEKNDSDRTALDVHEELKIKNLGASTRLHFSTESEKCQINKINSSSSENVNQEYNHVKLVTCDASLSLDNADMHDSSMDKKGISSPVLKRAATSSLFGRRPKKIPSSLDLPNFEKNKILQDQVLPRHVGRTETDTDKVGAENNCSQQLSLSGKEFKEIEFSDVVQPLSVNTPPSNASKDVLENSLPDSEYLPILSDTIVSDRSGAAPSISLSEDTRDSVFSSVSKKPPCGLASMLARKHRISTGRTAALSGDAEQAEARIKVDLIKASVVLPFHTFPSAECSTTLEKSQEVSDVRGMPLAEGQHNDECKELRMVEKTDLLSTKVIDNSPSHYEEIISLENEEPLPDMDNRMENSTSFKVSRSGGIIVSPSGHSHRGWWPCLIDDVGTRQKESASTIELDFPSSISELYKGRHLHRRQSNNDKKLYLSVSEERKTGCSVGDETWSALTGNYSNRAGQEQELDDFRPFDYGAAKILVESDPSLSNTLFDKNVVGKEKMGKRGDNISTPQNREIAFDPLRRFREEFRSQSSQPGRRRQVFPQSGNRTGIFK